jgi:ornithine--oxo-acid transaminase
MSKTDEYIERSLRYGAHLYKPIPVVIERAEGVYMWDVEGTRYIDMLSAYGAVNQGHRHPRILAAARKQMEKLCLTSRAFENDQMGFFLQRICEVTGMDMALPMNGGAEAVESGIKAMRRWGYLVKGIPEDQAEIIVCEQNFHGRTTTIVGFSSDEGTWRYFGPATPGFVKIPYNDPDALAAAITPNTCGFLVEPIQGEAGVIIPDDDFLPRIRQICTDNNVLLCLDEIQTGLARTGKMFCAQHYDVHPDITITGKALSGGLYPISAIAGVQAVMELFQPGTHGSTYGGNPLASAIGIEALNVLEEENMAERAAEMGTYILDGINRIECPLIRDRRGKGMLIAIEFHEEIAKQFCKIGMKHGFLAKDTHGTTVRFAPPLVITKEQADEAITQIAAALTDLEAAVAG